MQKKDNKCTMQKKDNNYENFNAKKEIDKFTEKIRQLVISNNQNTTLLKDIEDIKKPVT